MASTSIKSKESACRRFIRVVPALCLLLAAGCGRFSNPFADRVLARVGDHALYMQDVESIFTPGMPEADSLKLLDTYVDQWVKKQLKIQEAEKALAQNQAEIDRMVEDYRNSLLTFKVDQYYVDQRIDTLFTDAQITAYYQQNRADFILGKSIVKAIVVKVPVSYRQLAKLRELMQSAKGDDYQDFVDICLKNNFAFTELSEWNDFSSLLQLFPTEKEKNYDYLLKSGKVEEFRSGGYVYLVKVRDSRSVGDYSPQESVTDVIKRVIFNQRKQEIVRSYEDSLYRAGLQNKEIEINLGDRSAPGTE